METLTHPLSFFAPPSLKLYPLAEDVDGGVTQELAVDGGVGAVDEVAAADGEDLAHGASRHG